MFFMFAAVGRKRWVGTILSCVWRWYPNRDLVDIFFLHQGQCESLWLKAPWDISACKWDTELCLRWSLDVVKFVGCASQLMFRVNRCSDAYVHYFHDVCFHVINRFIRDPSRIIGERGWCCGPVCAVSDVLVGACGTDFLVWLWWFVLLSNCLLLGGGEKGKKRPRTKWDSLSVLGFLVGRDFFRFSGMW